MRSLEERCHCWIQKISSPSASYVPSEIMLPSLLTVYLGAVFFKVFRSVLVVSVCCLILMHWNARCLAKIGWGCLYPLTTDASHFLDHPGTGVIGSLAAGDYVL